MRGNSKPSAAARTRPSAPSPRRVPAGRGEDEGGEGGELAPALPRRPLQARLQAGFFQKLLPPPPVLPRHLREQQAAREPFRHQQAVLARNHLLGLDGEKRREN